MEPAVESRSAWETSILALAVSSSLSAVLAQRLVRTVHKACRGAGCVECLHSGFKGRTGVFELLVLDAALRDLVTARRPATDLKQAAQRAGMITLRAAGEALIKAGATTLEELGRVIDAAEEVPS